MPRILDLTGHRYGRLTVMTFSHRTGNHSYWWARCDCGMGKLVISNKLRTGATLSCGCLNKETKSARWFKHGLSRLPEHKIWRDMKRRCNDPRHHAWNLYGGRGISVCERWQISFEAFREDMGPRAEGTEIDRIDNDGNYEPNNCRWTTRRENARNRRTNRLLSHNGENLCIAAWSEKTGIGVTTILARLKRGCSTAQALTTPTTATGRVL